MLEAVVVAYSLLDVDCELAIDVVKGGIADRVPVW
jgi:hypothetical protein